MLRPEDWMMGGYEPSVTFWGPLEAEYIAERLLDLMPLAMSPSREDSASDGATRLATASIVDNYPIDDPAPMRGTIPTQIPAVTWARTGTPAQAQPPATIARVSGIATFTWIGDDPETKTPHVTLQFEAVPNSGNFAPVTRRSGRIVDEAEVVIAYTPSPLQRPPTGPQTHVWVAEWQAVPWFGAPNVDALDARGGVPLGRYRFHVDGNGWSLDSNPFQVAAGGVVLTSAKRTGGMVQVSTAWHAPKGWRLMDPILMSNQPVPIRSQQVTVTLLASGGTPLSSTQVTTDAAGNAQVTDDIAAVSVKVTDRFGNSATGSI
jgi:neutral ceramidase